MRELLWIAPNYLGFSFAALMVAALYNRSGPLAIVFLITPLVVLRLVHRAYEDLEEAHSRTLYAFIRAVELKDPYTRGHSERVAEVASAIHRERGADEAELKELYQGAVLHDIGKVGVSGRILSKPGKLTSDEYDVMKLHPVIGAEVAEEIEFLRPQLAQIRSHHERLDGGGYPDGLTADQIPDSARILAVADTFDALTSDRAYRPGKSIVEALEEMRRVVGTQLDGSAVDALERVLSSGVEFTRPLLVRRPPLSGASQAAIAETS
jgi:putative nucleotidyltransferase with HDIG domain